MIKAPKNLDRTPYGVENVPITPKEKKVLENILTKLRGNAVLSTRLMNALQLQDVPGHPMVADLSMVRIITDMFQAGFANYEYINPPTLEAINIGAGENGFYRGYFASPNPLPVPGDPLASIFVDQESSVTGANAFAMYRNTQKDIRVCNAWVKYLPDQEGDPNNLNPSTDTHPLAIHCEFLLDGNIVWEQVQNNLVASAADWSFMSQTADSNWNGIVPKGAVFSFRYYMADGTTGLPTTASNADHLSAGLIALGVPFGAQLPV